MALFHIESNYVERIKTEHKISAGLEIEYLFLQVYRVLLWKTKKSPVHCFSLDTVRKKTKHNTSMAQRSKLISYNIQGSFIHIRTKYQKNGKNLQCLSREGVIPPLEYWLRNNAGEAKKLFLIHHDVYCNSIQTSP